METVSKTVYSRYGTYCFYSYHEHPTNITELSEPDSPEASVLIPGRREPTTSNSARIPQHPVLIWTKQKKLSKKSKDADYVLIKISKKNKVEFQTTLR